MIRKLFLTIIFLFIQHFLFSQSAVTLRYFGLTIHPFGDDLAKVEPYKLDKKAFFVGNFGSLAGYEKYVWEDIISIKILQGVFTDCSAGLAGVTHLGFRGVMFDRGRSRISFGMGPTLYYRKDWNRFPEYTDSGFFSRFTWGTSKSLQYKIFWYGCEFEYDCKLSNKIDFNFGFTPGAPLALAFSCGVKYWFSREFSKSEKLVIPHKKRTSIF